MSDSQVMMITNMGVKDDPAQVAHVLCTRMHPCAPQSEALVLTLVDLQKDCHHYPRHFLTL
jgi:hypothetical protein